MRRLARWITGALPLDDRGRRAMDETLADWEHEDAMVTSVFAQTLSAAQSLLALARTFSLLAVRETWSMPVGWTLGRFVPMAVVSSVALTMSAAAGIVSTILLQHHVSLLGWLALMMVPAALPWACLAAIATTSSRRSPPLLGFTAIAVAASLVMSNWIGPEGSQQLRRFIYQILTGQSIGHELTRGLQEMRARELVELALAGSSRARGAATVLLLRISLAMACPLMVFLAARLRRATRWIRVIGIASFPIAFVVGINGPLRFEWTLLLAFLGSLALTWGVRDPGEPSASATSV